ncbi:DUF4157 domain-containing protein [Amycolatopsis sp. NPDC059657]|uniref:eCIS core domain-containing protein n=1 Tax=Amycolatopsis sp. NPDC059657 TaxID=3346899 RepID=UPI0036705E53
MDGPVHDRAHSGPPAPSPCAAGAVPIPDAMAELQSGAGNQAVAALLGTPGRALDPSVRSFMEQRFGTDFGRVRVHTDSSAAQAVHARAFTFGDAVVFGPGQYAPETPEGTAALAHELAHVVQQRAGGHGKAQSPGLEADADRAASAVAAGKPAAVSGGAPVGVARLPETPAAKPAAEPRYEWVDENGKKQQGTAAELAELKKQAESRVRQGLRKARDYAENNRSTHEWFMKEVHGSAESLGDVVRHPGSLIGIAVDIRSGVVPPHIGMWSHAIRWAKDGERALAEGNLREAARLLAMADRDYRDSVREWNAYMDAIQKGGQKLVGELEVVRDVSFAIAITAAVILAAPVVATGVAATGATGALATGATALGTGGVGAVVGAGLRSSASAAGQKIVHGKVSYKETVGEAKRGAREGFVTGLTAGAGHGLGSAGAAGGEGLSFGQQVVRRAAVEGSTNAVGQATDAALQGKSAGEVLEAGGTGFATGVVTAPLGTAGARLASGGRPLLGKSVEIGGSSVIAGGVTLAAGGTWQEATTNASIAAASATALGAAKQPARRVRVATREEAPKVRVATEPETAGGPRIAVEPEAVGGPRIAVEPEPARGPRIAVEPEPVGGPRIATEQPRGPRIVLEPEPFGGPSAFHDEPPPSSAPPKQAARMRLPEPVPEPLAPASHPEPAPHPAPAPQPPAAATPSPAAAPPHTAAPIDRVAAQENVVAKARTRAATAQTRVDNASTAVTTTAGERTTAAQRLETAKTRHQEAAAKAETAVAAVADAKPGAKRPAISARKDANEQLRKAASELAAAEKAHKAAADGHLAAEAELKLREEQLIKRAGELKTSEGHLENVQKWVLEPGEAPRQRRGEPFSEKNRRPNLSEFKDLPTHPVARSTPSSLPKPEPDARVRVFKNPVRRDLQAQHKALHDELKANPGKAQELGHVYERLVGEDLTRGGDAPRLRSDAGDKLRVSDHGVHEFTVEGELSDGKLDQLWRDLLTPTPGASVARDSAMLTVPELTPDSAKRLAKMAAAYEELTGRRPMILVRETAP